jgi:hypothetical protein
LLRFRRARGTERQQLKWFAAATAAFPVLLAASNARPLLPESLRPFYPAAVLFAVTVAIVPVAMGIAILRFRLYEIDLIIRRTLVYGALTAALGLVYWAGIVVLQQLLRPLTPGSDLAIVGSTLAVAALFQPLRHRIQQTLERGFYRRRYDAVRTLEEFSSRMRADVDLDHLGAELLAAVSQTMQPQYLSLWLRPPTERKPVNSTPRSLRQANVGLRPGAYPP